MADRSHPDAQSPASAEAHGAELLEAVRALHLDKVGVGADVAAFAPLTWPLSGETIDACGGTVLMATVECSCAVAATLRDDSELNIASAGPSPLPTDQLEPRFRGLLRVLVNRQLLSRAATGLDITVLLEAPEAVPGLGAFEAAESALALALCPPDDPRNDAPHRARLAELCAEAARPVAEESQLPPVNAARFIAALRGAPEVVSLVDYGDESVSQTPHPEAAGLRAIFLARPQEDTDSLTLFGADEDKLVAEAKRRQGVFDEAARMFGVASICRLPDAAQRLPKWLSAVRSARPDQGYPTDAELGHWLQLVHHEDARGRNLATQLRGQSPRGIATEWAAYQEELAADARDLGLQTAGLGLVPRALDLGADAARAIAGGTVPAVVALVRAARVEEFTAAAERAGLLALVLRPGHRAEFAVV